MDGLNPDFDDTASEQELIDGLLPHHHNESSDTDDGDEILGEVLVDPEMEENLKILKFTPLPQLRGEIARTDFHILSHKTALQSSVAQGLCLPFEMIFFCTSNGRMVISQNLMIVLELVLFFITAILAIAFTLAYPNL